MWVTPDRGGLESGANREWEWVWIGWGQLRSNRERLCLGGEEIACPAGGGIWSRCDGAGAGSSPRPSRNNSGLGWDPAMIQSGVALDWRGGSGLHPVGSRAGAGWDPVPTQSGVPPGWAGTWSRSGRERLRLGAGSGVEPTRRDWGLGRDPVWSRSGEAVAAGWDPVWSQ